MKQSLLLFLSVFLLTATANTAQAFDKKDLAKLKKTKKCVKYDLSKANLIGANLYDAKLSEATWTDGRKCHMRSIARRLNFPSFGWGCI